ncbi:MAG: hypothetical protein H6Q90_5110 [Deltaproteobacteria bacterium]|nr:hypothetical protein [Deltaproteobacteria bacterium]
MSRRLIALLVMATSRLASADDPSVPGPEAAASTTSAPGATAASTSAAPADADVADVAADPGDQSVGASMGVATGGRVTPGGVRITGHYLYQLSSQDWFDGTASFTFGGGDAACFRDRMDVVVCQHGIADGGAIELAAGVRRLFAPKGAFRPFARAAIGISYVRFGDDDVSGLAIPLHLGAGVRARVSPVVALVGMGELMIGVGKFGRGLGTEPQLGLAVTAGAEFQLK